MELRFVQEALFSSKQIFYQYYQFMIKLVTGYVLVIWKFLMM